jgi:hypothetical protein
MKASFSLGIAGIVILATTGHQTLAANCQGPTGLVSCKQVPVQLDASNCKGTGSTRTCALTIEGVGKVDVKIPKTKLDALIKEK